MFTLWIYPKSLFLGLSSYNRALHLILHSISFGLYSPLISKESGNHRIPWLCDGHICVWIGICDALEHHLFSVSHDYKHAPPSVLCRSSYAAWLVSPERAVQVKLLSQVLPT